MSLIFDFYKGNGAKTPRIFFKRQEQGWWYLKVFRLTVVRAPIDIVEQYAECIKIFGKINRAPRARRVRIKKER